MEGAAAILELLFAACNDVKIGCASLEERVVVYSVYMGKEENETKARGKATKKLTFSFFRLLIRFKAMNWVRCSWHCRRNHVAWDLA